MPVILPNKVLKKTFMSDSPIENSTKSGIDHLDNHNMNP
jgi:hypothetical protein